MSVHLIECASELQLDDRLTATHKLAMLCFADSGSAETRIARPGLEALLRWTCAKRSWALEVVNDLVEWQLLSRHRRAYRGQRAEFVVFPNGCCERHGKVPADVRSVEVVEVVEAAPEKGSGGADPLPDAGFSTGSAASADPVDTNGSAGGDVMGPPAGPNGSGEAAGKGPVATLKSGALQVLTSEQPPTALPLNGDCPQQPLPSREGTGPTFEFGQPLQPATGVRVTTPRGAPLGCRHCDAGWVCDSDGLPLERCPHCHPALRHGGRSA